MSDTTQFSTPTIDAALLSKPQFERTARRFTEAKQIIVNALAQGRIYNVEFESMKSNLSYGQETALDVITDGWQCKTLGIEWGEWYDMVSSNFPTVQIAGRMKRVEKWLAKQKNPAVATVLTPYLDMLKELAPIGAAIIALKPLIIKGRRPAENPTPVDMSGTGTCPICGRLIKLYGDTSLVDHGFQISDGHGQYLGFRNGRCYAVGYPPYEMSVACNQDFAKTLAIMLADAEKKLNDLTTGKVQVLTRNELKWVNGKSVSQETKLTPASPLWPRELQSTIYQAQSQVEAITRNIEWNNAKINNWVEKPLPHGPKGAKGAK